MDNGFQTVQEYFFDGRHGNTAISAIGESNASALGIAAPPPRWAFLDTETTGLSGGTGTYAFLIGIGEVYGSGFLVHQFFMRDFDEEPLVLEKVQALLERFDVLVTYNGKSFDAPLLETRYRLARRPVPHERMEHLDLLHSARRLWKLRLKNCRLMDLESSVLGVSRGEDIPGYLIPAYYFEYLRRGYSHHLAPIFRHNRMDIVSLACLTSLVLAALGDPSGAPLSNAVDLFSLAAWVGRTGKSECALELFAKALERGLPAEVATRARWNMAAIHKRSRNYAAALPLWREMDTAESWVELAKYHEHRARDYPSALSAARNALAYSPSEEHLHRIGRLEKRTNTLVTA